MHQQPWIQMPLDKCKQSVFQANQDTKTPSSFLQDTFKMLVDNHSLRHKNGNLKQTVKVESQMIQ
jgi:hypothetical protein